MRGYICLAALSLAAGVAFAQTQSGSGSDTQSGAAAGTQSQSTSGTSASGTTGTMPETQTQTYKGTLVDASCASGSPSASAATPSASNESATAGTENKTKAKKASRKASGGEGAACQPSAGTSQFALKLADGRTVKFDSVGNTRAQEVLKTKKKWTDASSAGKPIHAKVSGVLTGDTLTVVSLD